jgi:hypothetical protein
MNSMDATYLDQLKQQRATIVEILQSQRENQGHYVSTGVEITVGMYNQILEDALTTLNSLIDHLAARTDKTQ